MPDIQDFVCGGYFITKPVSNYGGEARPELPRPLVTVSRCINDNFFPDDWAIDWMSEMDEDTLACANAFGIDTDLLPELRKEIGRLVGNEIGYPNVCRSLTQAHEQIAKYHVHRDDLLLLGIGLKRQHREELLARAAPAKGTSASGVYEMISSGQELMAGGKILGSDVVNLDDDTSILQHSFLCNSLEKDYREKFGTALNEFGLIADHDAADACATYTNDEKTGAEPGYWAAWRVASYPL